MSTRLGDLVESLGGELIGDPDVIITGIAPLDAATASHITFLSNPRLRATAMIWLQPRATPARRDRAAVAQPIPPSGTNS